MEAWAHGDYTGSSEAETLQLNSMAIGRVREIDDFLTVWKEGEE